MARRDNTFVKVAEQIQILTTNGSVDSVDGLSKSLKEVEGAGYDVSRLQKWEDELEDTMEKHKADMQGLSDMKKRVEEEKEDIKQLKAEILVLQAEHAEEQARDDELLNRAKKIIESFQPVSLPPF
ncbi:hypothetical protein QJS10_CPB14g00865 [Acorus calamus]|uniref:Uncharacterized protein n=1 Tax=Acorus calamus TaxID=4465 RepID=A0AAV9DAB7_ACOCL|nr:hypothetical protein QJS10_CPB14g00865 [Acorus calamus]